ncbi:MAG: hypothetical protein ISQ86_11280, partial [Alphaproteobacteria bacterium]|nr:hypothetical protein [Alphaproteobacteria bacterium]
NTAFLYDNAAAVIALIGCNDIIHARRIGDAMLLAQDHDRFWHDSRLRNAYAAGPLDTPVKLSGWWDTMQNRWFEDSYQVASDNGNMAWAMLALLTLHRATQDARYRDAAVRLGEWTLQWQRHNGPGGFAGGTFDQEPYPKQNTWRSTEHNTDLAAAYAAIEHATGDRRWRAASRAAGHFVRAMWQPACHCYAVGAGLDGVTPNTLFALDAQIWPVLAHLNTAPPATILASVDAKLAQSGGYAYSEALQGLWTEGTAQVALLAALSRDMAKAATLSRTIGTMRTPQGGYYASDVPGLPTGFMLDTDPTKARQYFHIRALAPLAWAALVERRFNPFATR